MFNRHRFYTSAITSLVCIPLASYAYTPATGCPSGDTLYWPPSGGGAYTLPYQIVELDFSSTEIDAIVAGFSGVSNTPGGQMAGETAVVFQRGAAAPQKAHPLNYLGDGINEIFKATIPSGEPAASHVTFTQDPITGDCTPIEFDIALNSSTTQALWDTTLGPAKPRLAGSPNTYYTYLVTMHEAMHVLGLDEDNATNNLTLMEPYPDGGVPGVIADLGGPFRVHADEHSFLSTVYPLGIAQPNTMLSRYTKSPAYNPGAHVAFLGWNTFTSSLFNEEWDVCPWECKYYGIGSPCATNQPCWASCQYQEVKIRPTKLALQVTTTQPSETVNVEYYLIQNKTDTCSSGILVSTVENQVVAQGETTWVNLEWPPPQGETDGIPDSANTTGHAINYYLCARAEISGEAFTDDNVVVSEKTLRVLSKTNEDCASRFLYSTWPPPP